MSEDNNKLGGSLDNKPKTPSLGKDFEAWLQGREKQKNFLEQKSHLDTRSELADLKDSLGKKPHERIGGISEKISPSPKGDMMNSPLESIALTDTILTRQSGDEKKGILQGIEQLAFVPLRAFKDGIIDVGRIALSPIKETQRTIAYLEQESSAKII